MVGRALAAMTLALSSHPRDPLVVLRALPLALTLTLAPSLALTLTLAPSLALAQLSPRALLDAPAVARFDAAERHTLANGLEVVIAPGPERRQLGVCLAYEVGSRDDPAGYGGLAHLVEHLMFEGSRHVPDDGVHVELERAGSLFYNAFTSHDETVYVASIPSHALERVLWLESDRMAYLLDRVDARSLDLQRAVVLHEHRDRVEEDARSGFGRALVERLWPEGHPYRARESVDDLRAISVGDVQWFFQQHYRPDRAVLALTGGVDRPVARAVVERWFGSIRPSSAEARPRAEPGPVTLRGETRFVYEARTEERSVWMAWVTPPWLAPGDAELDVIAHALAAGPHARLRALIDAGLAIDVGARQSSEALGSTFLVRARLPEGVPAQRVVEAIDAELARLRDEGPSELELARAQEAWVAQSVADLESPSERACLLAHRTASGPVRLAELAGRYARLDVAGVRAATSRWLPSARRVVASLEPSRRVSVEGRVRDERFVEAP